MTLSAELIAESMARFGGELLLAQDRTFEFGKIQMLSPDRMDGLSDGVLYISQPKLLYKLPKSEFRDHCFVFKARAQQLERYRNFVNAVVFDDSHSINELINHLMNLFAYVNGLEQELRQAALDGGDFTGLMDIGRRMFPESVLLLVDSAYNVIAASNSQTGKNQYVDTLLKSRFYDRDSLDRMASNSVFSGAERNKRGAVLRSGGDRIPLFKILPQRHAELLPGEIRA